MKRRMLDWIASVVTLAALAGFVAMFAVENAAFRRQVADSARYDLSARTALAASSLREALETGDMPQIFEFGERCRADGMRLVVRGERGGMIYDSQPGADADEAISHTFAVADHTVSLSVPRERVLAPLRRARTGFLLAALVGASGVMLFFFISYRQRVRIRELARLERFRREFVADVSHEIKTPLTGIIGAVDLLQDGEPADGPRGRLLAMVKRESERLNALAQGILDLARIERADQLVEKAEADLAEVASDTVESLRAMASAAGMSIVLDAPRPVRVVCDAQLVSQAMSNLVVNAIRHSGSPDVIVRVAETRTGAEVVVEDHGRGIPPEDAPHVFERFRRVDPSRAAETGGAGLGLSIVRGIARLHGGEVRLESVSPTGSRFLLHLPR
ncbi:MAG: HAMP domain-containing histidine kinase [Kiritimatiellae bacterium]|nr:HAMP domain-containing histidine kinase [Kiritimatiellia bacterium]